jgi:hypothetical protein
MKLIAILFALVGLTCRADMPALPAQPKPIQAAYSNRVEQAENLIVDTNGTVIVAPLTNVCCLPDFYFTPQSGPFVTVNDASSNFCTAYFTNGQRVGWPIYEPRVNPDGSLNTNDIEAFGYGFTDFSAFFPTNKVEVTIGGMTWICATNPTDNWFGIGIDNQDGTYGVKESTSLPVSGNPVIVLGATNNLISIIQTPLNRE